MAGAAAGSNLVTVLTDTQGTVDFPQIPATVRARIFPAKRAGESPLPSISIPSSGPIEGARNWQIGMVHGSMAVPGRFDGDDVSFTEQEVAQSNLDYLALGHWHSFRQGKTGRTVWAYSGAPEAVAVDQDGAGQVLMVTLDDSNGQRAVSVEARPVGRTVFQKLDVDAATLESQSVLEGQLKEQPNQDLVLDVRVLGVRSNELDLNADELERQLASSFLRLRVRDSSVAALSEDPIAPADTILGAFTRDLRTRIAEQEQKGDADGAAESREALRIGLALLDDPSRVTLA